MIRSITKQDFISRVMLIMAEFGVVDRNGDTFTGADTVSLDRLIESSYVDAWRRCANVMDRTWFRTKNLIIAYDKLRSVSIVRGSRGFVVGDTVDVREDTPNGYHATLIVNDVSLPDGRIKGLDVVDSEDGFETGSNLIIVSTSGAGDIGIADLDLRVQRTERGHIPNFLNGTGYVILPSDFYLLSKFQMKGWHKPVTEATILNDRVSNIQSNEYSRGSEMRPCVVVEQENIKGEAREVLTYYSLPKGIGQEHVVRTAMYVPMCKELRELGLEDRLDVDIRVLEPLAYLSASTVLVILEKYDIAKSLDVKVAEMLVSRRSTRGKDVILKQ